MFRSDALLRTISRSVKISHAYFPLRSHYPHHLTRRRTVIRCANLTIQHALTLLHAVGRFFESARNALTGRTGLEYAMDPRCNYCAITAVSESTSAPFRRQLFSMLSQTAYLRMNELEQILNCLDFLLCLTSPASYRAVQSSIIQGQL
jgi:hypothetical protein